MNANELAKLLEVDSWRQQAEQIENLKQWERRHLDVIEKQQAEIEALKQIIDANNLNQNIGQFVKPTNEPVAWMHQNPDYAISKHQSLEYNIPLYTHPVEEQDESFDRTASHMAGEYVSYKAELTDEEIKDFLATFPIIFTVDDLCTFARAILRKAQEK